MLHCTKPYSPPRPTVIKNLTQHTSCYAKRSAEFTHKRFLKNTADFKKKIELGEISDRFAQDIDNYYQKAAGESRDGHA
jgi:hypothetical protein